MKRDAVNSLLLSKKHANRNAIIILKHYMYEAMKNYTFWQKKGWLIFALYIKISAWFCHMSTNEFLNCGTFMYSCICFIYFHYDGQLLVMSCQKIAKWKFWENTVIQLFNNGTLISIIVYSNHFLSCHVLLAAPFSHNRERQGQGICPTRFLEAQQKQGFAVCNKRYCSSHVE